MIQPCQCVYPNRCSCTDEQRREGLIQKAAQLRKQGNYEDAAALTRELRGLTFMVEGSRSVLITVTAEYTIPGGDYAYADAKTFEEAVEIDRQSLNEGRVGIEEVLDWANADTVQVVLELLPEEVQS